MIEVERLERRFDHVTAVAGIDFAVAEGEIFGFLGPNGAGKSTTIKMLATLLPPSAGHARVAGHDVVREPAEVRATLGLLFQDPSVDDRLTARENLKVHCMIYGVPRKERAARIDEALAWIGLDAKADELVRTFSGGMRRRLEVARALTHRPRVLFLDEPTTGLDPQTRRALWDELRALRERDRLTIFMSTHYMDEAENCDRIAIIDHGKLVAQGTPAEIKRHAGAERITLATADDTRAIAELASRGLAAKQVGDALELEVERAEAVLPTIFPFPVEILALSTRKPTLEDAFIALTGHQIRPEEAGATDVLRRAARARGRMSR